MPATLALAAAPTTTASADHVASSTRHAPQVLHVRRVEITLPPLSMNGYLDVHIDDVNALCIHRSDSTVTAEHLREMKERRIRKAMKARPHHQCPPTAHPSLSTWRLCSACTPLCFMLCVLYQELVERYNSKNGGAASNKSDPMAAPMAAAAKAAPVMERKTFGEWMLQRFLRAVLRALRPRVTIGNLHARCTGPTYVHPLPS